MRISQKLKNVIMLNLRNIAFHIKTSTALICNVKQNKKVNAVRYRPCAKISRRGFFEIYLKF